MSFIRNIFPIFVALYYNVFDKGRQGRIVQYLAGHENSKTTMDIYAKVKYNKPEELFGVVNGAFQQAIAE